MSASTGILQAMLAGDDPIEVVFYRDDRAREDLLDLCELLAPRGRELLFADAVDDVFLAETREALLLVTPGNETAAVRALEGRREELLERHAPAVLFLLQGGAAEEVLHRDAPSLSSFLRGLVYDPEPAPDEADMEDQRAGFAEKHGRSADEWWEAWRRDEIEDTAGNNLTAQEAWALRTPRPHGTS